MAPDPRLSRRLLLGGAGALLAFPAPARSVPAALPIDRLALPWWRARFAAKARELARHPPGLVLYGDSIFQDFELTGPEPWRDFRPLWQHYFAPRQTVDLGFRGDATSHLLWRVLHGEAAGITPKVAMILIGANNFGRLAWSAEDTELGILAVLEALRPRLPHTRLLLLGILPSARGPVVAAKTAAVNAALLRRFGNDGDGPVVFLDLSPVFLKGGRLDESLFLDPLLSPPEAALHPNVKGATWMMEAIAPTLLRLWRD